MNLTKLQKTYITMAENISEISKCAAKKVGAIIVNEDNNIISVGVNGTKANHTNCCEIFRKVDGQWEKKRNLAILKNGEVVLNKNVKNVENIEKYSYDFYPCEDQEEHHKWSKIHEIHAEMNALERALTSGNNVKNAKIFCTHSPCQECAKSLSLFGIKEIYFTESYDNLKEVVEYLTLNEINIFEIDKEKDIIIPLNTEINPFKNKFIGGL